MSDGPPDAPFPEILQTWRDVVGGGNPARLAKRLEWSGIARSAIGRALGAEPPEGLEIPTWANLLRDMMEAASSSEPCGGAPLADSAEQTPFEHLLAPLVTFATERWGSSVPDLPAIFLPTGILEARQFLLRRLADRAAPTLLWEFRETSGAPAALEPPSTRAGTSAYLRFVESTARSGWARLLDRYPVLGRQLGETVRFWIDDVTELSVRLAGEREALEGVFFGGRRLGRVRRMEQGAGDLHVGGRSTVLLEFEAGERLVYKPRDVTAEATWFGFLAWVNERFPDHDRPFRVLRVAEGDGYGWVELVEHRPLKSLSEGRAHHRQAGRLLALVHVLGGVDCHFENLVVDGLDPVLVDLETLAHPRLERPHGQMDEAASVDSVMRTGLLPRWNSPAAGGRPLDLSALGCQSPQETGYPRREWHEVNNDRMRCEEIPTVLSPRHNRAFDDSVDFVLSDFEASLIDGFEAMYRWLAAERNTLLGGSKPIERLRSCPVRILLRATADYGRIIHDGAAPERLRDGVVWSIYADTLASTWLGRDRAPPFWNAIYDEHRSLIVGDVPRFSSTGSGEHLILSDGSSLPGCFEQNAYGDVVDRLARLSEADLHDQVEKIRRSLATWDMVHRGRSDLDPYLAAALSPA